MAEHAMQSLQSLYESRSRLGSLKTAVVALSTSDVEWWAAGPPEVLPWAGSWRGPEAVGRWFDILNGTLEYDAWEPYEYVVQGETVVEFVRAGGRVRANGRRYESDIVRVWTFRDGRITRVRSFYDTAKYVEAMRG
ncbi:MAG: nuclear transport factor 2 family protein [Euryarchaeota archaeon]|nr:nuclear transport factor 2 family protein [Euryarchaeota archaeon]